MSHAASAKAAFLGGVTLAAAGAFAAPATQPADSNQAMMQRLGTMQSQMDRMQSQLAQTQTALHQAQAQLAQSQPQAIATPATPQSQAVAPLDGQAQPHTWNLYEGDVVAGFDPRQGFFISTEDGSSYLHPGMFFEGYPTADLSHGRAPQPTGIVQIDANGNLFSRDFTFNFQINQAFGPAIETAEGTYDFRHDAFLNHDLALEAGIFKNPLYKQSAQVADWNQLFVQRSLVEDQIGGGQWGQQIRGVALHALTDDDTQPWNATLAGYFGDNPGGMALGAPGSPGGSLSLRGDYKFWGKWEDNNDLTAIAPWRRDLLDVGGGLAWENYDNSHGIRLTADAQWQTARLWSVFGAVYYDHFDGGDGLVFSRNDYGLDIEGGYRIIPQLQIVGRYSFTRVSPTITAPGGNSVFNEIGIGANYFLGRDGDWANHARVSLDLDVLPDGAPTNGVLYVPSNDSEVMLRGEFQLQF